MKIYNAQPILNEEIIDEINKVLKSGLLVQGPRVAELEQNFANYCGVKYCSVLNSGTAALHSALHVAGIKNGDEVITSPFTFAASANSILMVGAKPVFSDIDQVTFNIDVNKIPEKINRKTKGIMPVHLYGLLADMKQIGSIAKDRSLLVIEDASQAHGAEFNGDKAGSFGDISAFSFYATKNIMTIEGGCITTNNEEIDQGVKRFRHHGQSLSERYNYLDFGYNYRMTDLQAVIGIGQLKQIEKFITKRAENAKLYDLYLREVEGIVTPTTPKGYKHVFHQYTIKVNDDYGRSRDSLVEELKLNDIVPGVFYPKPLHTYPVFQKYGYKLGDFPIAEAVSKQVLSLPVHPGVMPNDIEKICEIISNFKK
jgi:perosamine synthetase